MAVTKRLRFEVLRRDNHTCRYCGGTAPDVTLTVDHVVPVALGGSDDPTNLVAACKDCNAGKSSVPADAHLVADVAADADRWAAAMRQAADENRLHDNTDVYAAVVNAWTSFRRNQIPGDYRESIDQFLGAGLPAEDIVQMAHVADAKPSIYDRWAYFCGCCWTRIRKLQEHAQEILSTNQTTAVETTHLPSVWTASEIDREVRAVEELAEGIVVASSIYCMHKTRDDAENCCNDPVCRVIWATQVADYTQEVSIRKYVRECRDTALMDELDLLEMADG